MRVMWLWFTLILLTKAVHGSSERERDLSPSSPSFLFMLVDDVGWADFSYNNGTARTPNIDAWARQSGSVMFQDFHSAGTVCSPTRATVLTGRHHFRDCVDSVFGCSDMRSCVPDFEFAPSNTFTVGDAIRAAGSEYEGGAFFAGKWHLGSFYNDSEAYGGRTSSPITHGFQSFKATVSHGPTVNLNCGCQKDWIKTCNFGHYGDENAFCRPEGDCCFNYWWDDPLSPHGVANQTWPTPDDDAKYLAKSFTRFLASRRRQNKPFLSQISFHNCHKPYIGTPAGKASCARGETCRPPGPGEPAYSEEELDYYACLTQLDDAVGVVLDALKDSGYYDNTMIWLTSDNGPEGNCPPTGICQYADTFPHRPSEGPGSAGPLRGRKRDVWEGGHRVPGIVSFPAIVDDNRVSWETIVTTDFLPTIMEILGVDRPPEQQSWAMDGRSILPLLKKSLRWEDTEEGPRSIGIGFFDPRRSRMNGWGFRYGRWKLVEGSRSCQRESCHEAQLYDLKTDLGERNDLAKALPERLAFVQERFEQWLESVMDSRQEESNCKTVEDLR